MKYCVIENGLEYNLHLSSTSQPSVIEDCIFRNSLGKGIYLYNSYDTIMNCTFEGNEDYGIYYNNAYYVGVLENLTFTGNMHDGVATEGGNISANRTWNKFEEGATYYILGNMGVSTGGYYYAGDPCRLTLSPGCTLKFAENANLQISNRDGSYYYPGELYAVGTEEQPITFTSMNDEAGGWNGLYFHDYSDNYTGQQSSLKYCIIENGNEYNLYINATNQPMVERCKLVHSNGYGLRIGNCSPTIIKSTIRDNATYGIYLTGNSSNPTIGGNYINGCNIYRNGNYNIYQDGGSNITMNYNYLGAVDSLYLETHCLYDKQDDNGKGRVNVYPVSWLPMHIGEYDCDGRLYYDNNADKPMAGVGLAVKDFQGETLAETTVDNNGDFSFEDLDLSVANKIEVTTGIDFPNAITSVSALFVKRHFAHLMTLEGNHAVVADVNKSQTINGTDALLIQRHVAHLISTFPTGDLLMATDTAYSDGNQFTMNLSALCYGDVDGRLSTFGRDNGLELEYDGHLVTESGEVIEIPVRINAPHDVAAITLRLGYPEEYIDIEDVTLVATGESLLHGGEAGRLNISWCNLNAIDVEAGETLLVIKARTHDLSSLEEEIAFTLEGYSELNDAEGNHLSDIMLLMPTMTTELLGLIEDTADAALCVYPNPTQGETVLRYGLSAEGRVMVSLFDVMGVKVADLCNERQTEGQQEVRFDTSRLAAGIYYCRFVFSGENEYVKTVKIVVEK